MSPARKRAYILLLRVALERIRSAAWSALPPRPWSPAWWARAASSLRHIEQLADATHNLPVFVAMDFEGFDEDFFWTVFVEAPIERDPTSPLRCFRDEFAGHLRDPV